MRGLISLSAMAIVLGQHVRVGNEDNLWGPDKKRRTSVQQIEGAVRICEEFGRKVATAEEAREIMKVGVWYDSVEETLMNLGLPPNRRDGEKGFLVWDTDGKKTVAKVAGDSHPIAGPGAQKLASQTASDPQHRYRIPSAKNARLRTLSTAPSIGRRRLCGRKPRLPGPYKGQVIACQLFRQSPSTA